MLAKVQDDALISIELGKTWKYKNRMELYKVDIIWVDSPAYPNFCKKKNTQKMYFYEIICLFLISNALQLFFLQYFRWLVPLKVQIPWWSLQNINSDHCCPVFFFSFFLCGGIFLLIALNYLKLCLVLPIYVNLSNTSSGNNEVSYVQNWFVYFKIQG